MDLLDASSFESQHLALASVPENIRVIQRLLIDPEVSIECLGSHIALEPTLAALLLKLANSPLYGLRQQVSSIPMALVVIGIKNTAAIINGITILSSMRDFAPSQYLQPLVHHSIILATLSSLISRRLRIRFHNGEDYLAGLLCDIGYAAIAHVSPEHFQYLWRHAKPWTMASETERNLIGIDHSRVGELTCEAWNYPVALIQAIGGHHHNLANDVTPTLPGIVRFAARLKGAVDSSAILKSVPFQLPQNHFASELDYGELYSQSVDIAEQTIQHVSWYC